MAWHCLIKNYEGLKVQIVIATRQGDPKSWFTWEKF